MVGSIRGRGGWWGVSGVGGRASGVGAEHQGYGAGGGEQSHHAEGNTNTVATSVCCNTVQGIPPLMQHTSSC